MKKPVLQADQFNQNKPLIPQLEDQKLHQITQAKNALEPGAGPDASILQTPDQPATIGDNLSPIKSAAQIDLKGMSAIGAIDVTELNEDTASPALIHSEFRPVFRVEEVRQQPLSTKPLQQPITQQREPEFEPLPILPPQPNKTIFKSREPIDYTATPQDDQIIIKGRHYQEATVNLLAGDDGAKGGRFDDTIIGGAGNDRLRGGKGNDILIGDDAGTLTNLVKNGSFETDIGLRPGRWTQKAEFGNWDAAHRIEIWNGLFGLDSRHGNQHVELDAARSVDSLSQTLETDIGVDYTLTFSAMARANTAPDTNQFTVSWDGAEIATITPTQPGWTDYSFTVTATSDQATLTFSESAEHNDSFGTLLDAISVRATTTQELYDDKLYGQKGDDLLIGGLGNDIINGGKGTDIAIFSGAMEDYVITQKGRKTIIEDTIEGRDGTDILKGVEGILFGAEQVMEELLSGQATDTDLPNPEDLTIDNILSYYDPISIAIEDFIAQTEASSTVETTATESFTLITIEDALQQLQLAEIL